VNSLASAITGAVAIVVGVLVAVTGLLLSVRASRRRVPEGGPTTRSDLTVALTVFGLVAVIFGAGDVAFLLLTTS
jgi:heme/copper-type cytochrome/quinol oxidase subunit 2